MDYFRRLLFRSREQQRPAALSFSVLQNIPMDILLYIVDCLPPASAVAFSLSCTQFRCLLRNQHRVRVISSTEHTLAVLKLLALDLPNQVVCYVCTRLHSMQHLHRYTTTTYKYGSTNCQYDSLRTPSCVYLDKGYETDKISKLFGRTAFKMAIKRYHQQPECRELLDIMSSKAAETTEIDDYVRLSREECRVIRGCLMHRLQSVYISRKCLPSTPSGPPFETICPHLSFRVSEHSFGSRAERCQKCRTEYRIDFKYYDDHGLAIFFTRWKDLGAGPEGEVWEQHLFLTPSLYATLDGGFTAQNSGGLQTQRKTLPQDSDLSSAFEDSDDFRFDSLLTASENKAKLFEFQNQCWAKGRNYL